MRADEVPIPAPCSASWSAMKPQPGARARHCADCNTRVHDLSAMGEADARAFLASCGDDVCVSYLVDAAGAIHFPTPDVPVGRLGPRRRGPRLGPPALGLALAACTPHGPPAGEALDVEELPIPVEPVHVGNYPDEGPPESIEAPCAPEPGATDPETQLRVKGKRKTIRRTAGKPTLRPERIQGLLDL